MQSSVFVHLKMAGMERYVFAGAKYEAGTLQLVPYSSNMFDAAIQGQERRPPSPQLYAALTLAMKGAGKGGGAGTFVVVFSAESAPRPPVNRELIIPYWLVRSTSDKEKANMHHSTLKVRLTSSTDSKANDIAQETVTIPILQNVKMIEEDEELVAYRDSPASQPDAETKRAKPFWRRLYQPKKKAKR